MRINKTDPPLIILSLIPLGYILDGMFPDFVKFTLILYIILYGLLVNELILKKERLSIHKLDLYFYLWAFVLLLGVLFTPFQMAGLFKAAKFILLALSLIVFTRMFIRSFSDFEKFFKYLILCSSLTGYIVLIDFISSGVETVRYMAFGVIIPIPLAMLGATTSLIALIMIYFKKINLLFFIFAIFPSIGVLTIAASKGPVIALLATLILLLPVFLKKFNLKVLTLILISTFLLSRNDSFKLAFENIIMRFTNLKTDMSTSIRLTEYNNAFEMFKSKPIFGMGTGSNYPDYPHNFFLEILSENGLILLVIIIAITVVLSIYFISFLFKRAQNYIEVLIYSLIFCSFVSLLFSFTYVDHKYFFLGLGLLLTFKILQKEQKFEYAEQESKKNKKLFKRYKIVWK